VTAALEKLKPPDREILLLKYTEKWSYEQLAEHLGVSVKTVEYRLLRARRAMRGHLRRMGEGEQP
jgi:RNA polymerase sigma-70 factor (ECF subfamily)